MKKIFTLLIILFFFGCDMFDAVDNRVTNEKVYVALQGKDQVGIVDIDSGDIQFINIGIAGGRKSISELGKIYYIHKIIDESSIDAIYDGKDLNIAANSNENIMYMQLNNDEIMSLLAMPASHLDLEKRLKKDFGQKKRKYTLKKRRKR